MTSTSLHLDFESRSTLDLRDVGTYVYAEHPTTDIWCAAYAFGDEEPRIWTLGQPCPYSIIEHIEDGGLIKAYNANFERIMWKHVMSRYGWPVPHDEQYHCVMVRAMAMSLPGDMERCALALGITEKKDMAGSRLMLQMARPRAIRPKLIWWDQPDKLERLYTYCKQDVRVEIAIEKRLMKLSDLEEKIYHLDQRINDRGVKIDARLCIKAREIIAETYKILDEEIYRISDGLIGACTNTQEITHFLKKRGVPAESIAKEAMEELLGLEIPADCRRVLELRKESAKTSVAKVTAMLKRMSNDGRMRGNLQYHGAGTGRWAARGAQLQNLPRASDSSKKIIRELINAIMTKNAEYIDMVYGPPLTIVSDCVRSMISASPNTVMFAGDYANIEGRVNAWLAGQSDQVKLFSENAPIYEIMAAKIYSLSVDQIKKESIQRQLGKAATLGCGFGMGWKKFIETCRKQSIIIDEKTGQRVIKTWRTTNDRIVAFWHGLEQAAVRAVQEKGKVFRYGKIAYRQNGSFLWCQLPSGRLICYPHPRLAFKETPWSRDKRVTWYNEQIEAFNIDLPVLPETAGTVKIEAAFAQLKPLIPSWWDPPLREDKENICFKGINPVNKQWEDQFTWGGSLVENVAQGTARDIMAEAMLRLEDHGYHVILTVHDEIVSEVAKSFGSIEEFTKLMEESPTWAEGCPIAVEAWNGARYRK